jgi:hypothetical protein
MPTAHWVPVMGILLQLIRTIGIVLQMRGGEGTKVLGAPGTPVTPEATKAPGPPGTPVMLTATEAVAAGNLNHNKVGLARGGQADFLV